MPGPYSVDLRKRVIAACKEGKLTRSEIASQYGIAQSTLYAWLQRLRDEKTLQPKPHRGGPVSGIKPELLREIVEAENDRTLAEYAACYAERGGRLYSPSGIWRALRGLRITRKKNAACQRAAQARDHRRAGGIPGGDSEDSAGGPRLRG